MHRYLLTTFLLCLLSAGVSAFEDPKKFRDIDPKYIDLNIIDPEQKVGFTVGDTITRQINITIKKPFYLVEESLPIVGYEKRYRGQLLGMSLVESSHTKKATKKASPITSFLRTKFLRTMWWQNRHLLPQITIGS